MALSQKSIILNHLKSNGSITSWGAIQSYRITRLAAIINDLRKEGYNISTEKCTYKSVESDKSSTYAKYVYSEPTNVGDNYNLSFT